MSLTDLSAVLSAAFGREVVAAHFAPVGEGANAATHYKVAATDGRTYGIKVSSRGVTNGTRREILAALSARRLGFRGARDAALIVLPQSTPFSGGQTAAVLEWLPGSEQLARLVAVTPSSSSVETARQVGEYIWLCMLLGVTDRHPGNWIWSERESAFAMIDCEEWAPGSQTPEQLRGVAQRLLGPLMRDHALAMWDAITSATARWAQVQTEMEALFSAMGEAMPANVIDDPRDFVQRLTGIDLTP